MDAEGSPEASQPEAKLFEDDFQEVPLDEPSDKAVKTKQAAKPSASADILDGLVEQAKFEEVHAQGNTDESTPSTQASQELSDTLTPSTESGAPLSASDSSDSATILEPSRLTQGQESPMEPQDADEDLGDDAAGQEAALEGDGEGMTLDPLAKDRSQTPASVEHANLPSLRVLEAALFLANKPMSHKQLQDLLQLPKHSLEHLYNELRAQLPSESAVELSVSEHGASLQLKPQYLHRVANLSKEVELSRKSMRILALVAKKKELLQSELKNFFKGEIYAYVSELKMAGYLDSKKAGNTRKLRPSTKFYESFQIK